MPTVGEIVRRILPRGTTPRGRRPTWRPAPPWPPDAFAVTASLASASGCYSRNSYTAHWTPGCLFNKAYRDEVLDAGARWAQGDQPALVQRLWDTVIAHGGADIMAQEPWCDAAMTLLAISDEASVGIGFVDPGNPQPIPDYVADQHLKHLLSPRRAPLNPRQDLPHLPDSLCWMVPASEVCVQPKARTPQVGCTLRSLSHHLALLPPKGEIRTRWLYALPTPGEEPLNVLLVPFPYRIDGNSFAADDSGGSPAFFSVRPQWLTWRRRPITGTQVGAFLIALVDHASREVRRVHGVVLPELALRADHALAVATRLARQTDLQFFITGVCVEPGRRSPNPQNRVFSAIFHGHRVLTWWDQAKHHRWRLDGDQIRRYQLGDALDPGKLWWEKMELQQRVCTFYVFRKGASLATLVCEDLARIDPVQTTLRAVGPNLVVVLLMDGPQLERRWPGRYATVLADDPGSSVLTLTSLGMVKRSMMPGDSERREIALWKEPRLGSARELSLPRDAHALLLTLSQAWEDNLTLDGRTDRGTTMSLALTGVRGVAHPAPPEWIGPA